jgi:hypothetical protein
MQNTIGNLLIEDLVTQKIMHWILPSPLEISNQFQGDSDAVKLFYLMYALSYPRKRRDTSPVARHAFDAAARDIVRPLGYNLTKKERLLVIVHDLPEDFGYDVPSSYVVSDIIGKLAGDETLTNNLNLITDHYAFVWKSCKKVLEKIEQEQMLNVEFPDIIDHFRKNKLNNVNKDRILHDYGRVKEKVEHFIAGLERIYLSPGRQRSSRLKVKDLSFAHMELIINILRDIVYTIDKNMKSNTIVRAKELNTKTDHITKETLSIIQGLQEKTEEPISATTFERAVVDRKFILYGENAMFVEIEKNLYYQYINRMIGSAYQYMNKKDHIESKNIFLVPLMAKLSDSIDNVRTLPKDNLFSMRNIFQKARCLIIKGHKLSLDLKQTTKNPSRLNAIIQQLFLNIEEKTMVYEKGIGDASTMDTSYIEALRLVITMMDKNESLKTDLFA